MLILKLVYLVKKLKRVWTKYGPNAITAKTEPMWLKFLKDFTGPIAYMIEAAAIVSAIINHWDDLRSLDLQHCLDVRFEYYQNVDWKSSS